MKETLLEDITADRRIILEWIFRACTGFIWLRIGKGVGRLCVR